MTPLKILNLSVGFKKVLIEGLHIEFQNGLHFVLGPNGAGKSAFFLTLSGNLQSKGGEVYLGNQNVTSDPADHRSNKIGFLPQKPDFGQFISGSEFMESTLQQPLESSILYEWNAHRLLSSPPSFLSQGEQQRLALCHFFSRDRPVMLLDEPFSSLDLHYQQKLKNFISQQKQKIILLTHHSPLINLHGVSGVLFIAHDKHFYVHQPLHQTAMLLTCAEKTYGMKFQILNEWLLPLVIE